MADIYGIKIDPATTAQTTAGPYAATLLNPLLVPDDSSATFSAGFPVVIATTVLGDPGSKVLSFDIQFDVDYIVTMPPGAVPPTVSVPNGARCIATVTQDLPDGYDTTLPIAAVTIVGGTAFTSAAAGVITVQCDYTVAYSKGTEQIITGL